MEFVILTIPVSRKPKGRGENEKKKEKKLVKDGGRWEGD
uniref:Uncharacterized protein n=1 Tax=Arundo donax TaxID=35708 RepID=A0A0A8YB56_ARUDO